MLFPNIKVSNTRSCGRYRTQVCSGEVFTQYNTTTLRNLGGSALVGESNSTIKAPSLVG